MTGPPDRVHTLAVLSRDSDQDGRSQSLRPLLTADLPTMLLLTVCATTPLMAAIIAFASAPYWRADPWIAAAAAFAGASLLVSPLILLKIRWLSHMWKDGALVEATRDGWGEFRPWRIMVTGVDTTSLPRYSYTYLGTIHHILFSTYYFTREPPNRLRVLVDPDHPERAVVLGVFAEDPLPERVHIPAFSTHIGPWLGRLDPGVKGCGCSLLIFLVALSVTGYGFGPSSVPPGPAFDAWLQVGLLSPVAGALYLIWRLVNRRR